MPETQIFSNSQPLIAIAGPTGSGKSSLALEIAHRFHGEVVNCDSMQLYRGFDVGTAKLPESRRQGICHHLIDVIHPTEVYSAGDYARHARAAIVEISARGVLPVITGGTGFYLHALLNGLPGLPGRNMALRERLTGRENLRPGALHRVLRRLDPDSARRIHARDTQKLIRALEIRVLTAQPLPPSAAAEPLQGYRTLKLGLNPDRADLYQILDARAREMFRSGLVEEVQRLLASGCTGKEKPFESLGYRQALQYVRGEITVDEAVESTQRETRRYAKRQWTWFRRDPEIVWLSGFGDTTSVIEKSLDLIQTFL